MPNSYSSWRTGIQIDNIYPVGSIYISVNSTNPHDLFGGSWEAIGGRFLIGVDSTYTAGSTGGAATVAHTHPQVAVTTGASSAANSGGPSTNTSGSTAISVAQMPSHAHQVYIWDDAGTKGNNYYYDGASQVFPGNGRMYYGSSSVWKSATIQCAVSGRGDISGGTNLVGSGSGHTHTLSSHTHTIAHTHDIAATTTGAASNTNNMPPYLAVYMWKRTA